MNNMNSKILLSMFLTWYQSDSTQTLTLFPLTAPSLLSFFPLRAGGLEPLLHPRCRL